MGEREEKEAFVTLATNDVYAIGCLVLGHSLRRVKTSRQLVVMVTPGVTEKMRLQLQAVFHLVQEVDLLDSKDEQNLSLLGRPDLNVTFTKLHCWRLTQFQKAVFLDADTLVLQNVDELFDREELSAAPDPGWPDCFNSGVFVYKPSEETYSRLLQFALTSGSFDGGDQGLLNLFFNDWPTKDIAKHLPFIYNVVSHAFYSYLPAFRQFKNQIKIVHFIGAIKPWHHPYNTVTRTVTTLPETYHSQEFLQYWWDIFIESVHPHLDPLVQKEETPNYAHNLPTSLPSPLPPPPPPTQHGMEGTGRRFGQPTSYQVLFPYVPPAVDQPSYIPPQVQEFWPAPLPFHPSSDAFVDQQQEHQTHPDSSWHWQASQPAACADLHTEGRQAWQKDHEREEPSVPRIIEMPIMSRNFHVFETYYSEEPMTAINPDSPPPAAYESTEFEDILTREAAKVVPAVKWEVPSGSGDAKGREVDGLPRKENGYEPREEFQEGAERSGKVSENGGGLVGELAQMKIVAGTGDVPSATLLGNRERRLAWERGQADYLGSDRFENIQKKLDQKLTTTVSVPKLGEK
ncbi:glycogenin-1-like isoform X3 [Pomacea canaliculata]|nr:glycogenin-1-like isoform X3 [Pomacea canaliculata]